MAPPLDKGRKWIFDTPEADYGLEAHGEIELSGESGQEKPSSDAEEDEEQVTYI